MVAAGYYINRIFGITLTIIFLTLSFIQIFLLRQNTKKLSDVKYFIHYSVCLSCATLLLSFIDSYGVFGLFPYIFSVMAVDVFGMKCLSTSALFIIYGHFDAHYRVLKQETPKFLKFYLSGIFILTLICSIVFQTLSYVTSNTVFITLAGINGLTWLYSVWIIDIYGYYLVRKFILELQKYSRTSSPSIHEIPQEEGTPTSVSSSSTPSLPPKKQGSSRNVCSNEFDYDGFLSRMRNFHILLTLATIVFSILTIFSLTHSSLRQSLNPNKFSFFDGLIFYPYLYFLVGCFLLWWVWLPIKMKDNCTLKLDSHHANSQKTTQIHSRNSGKVSKRENHHQEEMIILNSSHQNHDHHPQENSPQHTPDKNRFSYPPHSGVASNPDETSLIQENNHNNNHTREHSVSVSEMESPKKENRLETITLAGITEEGGIVSYDEK